MPWRPDLVVCLDSGCRTYDRLWVTTSLRGLVEATLRVDVLSHGVHSGLAGGIVPSSFRILRQLLHVEDPETGRVLLAGAATDESPGAPSPRWGLPTDLGPDDGLPTVPGPHLAGTDTADRVATQASTAALEVTGADGLPALSEAGNVLRPYTTLKLAMRIPPSADSGEGGPARLPGGPKRRDRRRGHASGWISARRLRAGWAPPLRDPLAEAAEQASNAYFGLPPGEYGIGGTIRSCRCSRRASRERSSSRRASSVRAAMRTDPTSSSTSPPPRRSRPASRTSWRRSGDRPVPSGRRRSGWDGHHRSTYAESMVTQRQITIETVDGPMPAYEARPDATAKGTVVVVQEAFGLTSHIEDVTRRLAAVGYRSVAPALFHRQGSPVIAYDDYDKVLPVMAELTAEGLRTDMLATIDSLDTAPSLGSG